MLISATRLVAVLVSLASASGTALSITPVMPPPPTAQELAAANSLVDTLQIQSLLHQDCALRGWVAKEAGERIASDNYAVKVDPDYRVEVQVTLEPLMTDALLDSLWGELKQRLAANLAQSLGTVKDIEETEAFFRTPAGMKISKQLIWYGPDIREAAGFLVWRALRPEANQIKRDALERYNAYKGGRTPPAINSLCG